MEGRRLFTSYPQRCIETVRSIRYSMNIKSVVLTLVIINVIVFLFTQVLNKFVPAGLLNLTGRSGEALAAIFRRYGLFITLFSLFPALIVKLGWVWQVFTYMFLHGGFFHIFFNMYALYLFGRPLEDRWGGREFLFFYLFSGVGAGIITFAWNLLQNPFIPTIGASGAIFGVVLAFGLEFPDAMLLLFFFIPVRAKYAAFIFGGIELVMIITGTMQGIGHFTHLAGLLFGYIYYVWRIKGSYRGKKIRFAGKRNGPGISGRLFIVKDRDRANVVSRAKIIKRKLDSGAHLTQSEERFLDKLREAYNYNFQDMCAPDTFNPAAEDCLKCKSLYACLYRYVLDIQ